MDAVVKEKIEKILYGEIHIGKSCLQYDDLQNAEEA